MIQNLLRSFVNILLWRTQKTDSVIRSLCTSHDPLGNQKVNRIRSPEKLSYYTSRCHKLNRCNRMVYDERGQFLGLYTRQHGLNYIGPPQLELGQKVFNYKGVCLGIYLGEQTVRFDDDLKLEDVWHVFAAPTDLSDPHGDPLLLNAYEAYDQLENLEKWHGFYGESAMYFSDDPEVPYFLHNRKKVGWVLPDRQYLDGYGMYGDKKRPSGNLRACFERGVDIDIHPDIPTHAARLTDHLETLPDESLCAHAASITKKTEYSIISDFKDTYVRPVRGVFVGERPHQNQADNDPGRDIVFEVQP